MTHLSNSYRRNLAFPLFALSLITFLSITVAYQFPYVYRVDVGRNDSAYVSGFYSPEAVGDMTVRWSRGTSHVNFHNAGQIVPKAVLRLNLSGYRPPDMPRPEMTLTLNDGPIAKYLAPRLFTTREFPLDASIIGDGDWVLTISSTTYQPENDPRVLGILLNMAELESKPPFVPPLATMLWAWLGSLSLFMIARVRLSVSWAFAVPVSSTLILAVTLALWREQAVYLLPWLSAVAALAVVYHLAVQGGQIKRMAYTVLARSPAATTLLLGLAFAGIGQLLLTWRILPAVGLFLLLAGIAGLLLFSTPRFVVEPPAPLAKSELVLIGLITAIGLLMRLYRLDQVPFAIFRDEARHGITALRILDDPGFRPIFMGPPISQPGPYFFFLAGSFQLFGVNLLALRFVSAFAAALTVPLLWLLTRHLFGTRVALLAAFGLAISTWQIANSRIAMPYVEPTLFALPAYFFLWRGMKEHRLLDWGLSGLLIASAQYAAQSSKALILIAALLVLDGFISAMRRADTVEIRNLIRGTLAACLVGLVVLSPLIGFVIEHPDQYLGRPGQVAIWNPEYSGGEYLSSRLLSNFLAYAGSFNVAGDPIGTHNLPGAPSLDPVFGVFFMIGITAAWSQLRSREVRFVLYWLIGGLVPGLLSVDAPSMLRTLEAAPAAYVLGAIGAVAIWDRVAALRLPWPRFAAGLSGAALLLGALVYSYSLYFVAMYNSPLVWRKFAPVATQLGETLKAELASSVIRPPIVVYVPGSLMDNPDEGAVSQFYAWHNWELRTYDMQHLPSPNDQTTSILVVPNYKDFWGLVAAAAPSYSDTAIAAAAEDQQWHSALAPFTQGANRIPGPKFPASDKEIFGLFRLR